MSRPDGQPLCHFSFKVEHQHRGAGHDAGKPWKGDQIEAVGRAESPRANGRPASDPARQFADRIGQVVDWPGREQDHFLPSLDGRNNGLNLSLVMI